MDLATLSKSRNPALADARQAAQMEAGRRVVAGIMEGLTLRKACAQAGCTLHAFHVAVSSSKELSVSYSRAREMQADVLVDEAISAVDNPDIDPQRGRNMADIRRWAASKYNQRVYGDRVDLNVSTAISITDALTQARSRASMPALSVPMFEDAEVVLDDKVEDIFT